jgi:hypothetical protein
MAKSKSVPAGHIRLYGFQCGQLGYEFLRHEDFPFDPEKDSEDDLLEKFQADLKDEACPYAAFAMTKEQAERQFENLKRAMEG